MAKQELTHITQLLWLLVLLFFRPCLCQVGDSKALLDHVMQQYLPAQYKDDVKALLLKKCHKAAAVASPTFNATDAYVRTNLAGDRLSTCLDRIMNTTEQLEGMKQNSLNELDEDLQKYCKSLSTGKRCLADFNAALQPCLTRAEQVQSLDWVRIVTLLMDYICDNMRHGNPIALFIAEKGVECFKTQQEHISNCMNVTFAAYLPKDGNYSLPLEFPELVMGPQQCIDMFDLEQCVVGCFDRCVETTPANMIESLFRHVRKQIKCQTVYPIAGNDASAMRNAVAAVLLANLLVTSLLRFEFW